MMCIEKIHFALVNVKQLPAGLNFSIIIIHFSFGNTDLLEHASDMILTSKEIDETIEPRIWRCFYITVFHPLKHPYIIIVHSYHVNVLAFETLGFQLIYLLQ